MWKSANEFRTIAANQEFNADERAPCGSRLRSFVRCQPRRIGGPLGLARHAAGPTRNALIPLALPRGRTAGKISRVP